MNYTDSEKSYSKISQGHKTVITVLTEKNLLWNAGQNIENTLGIKGRNSTAENTLSKISIGIPIQSLILNRKVEKPLPSETDKELLRK